MLDQYEIIRTIGEGGAGVVYEALQLASERIVAIKMLPDTQLIDESSLQRFKREAKTTSALDHPNIVKIFSFGIAENSRPYFVMEFLKGQTLAQDLKQNGPLTLARFQHVFLQVVSALEYAHSNGVVHRDIKPGNIMLCTDEKFETSKLLDFGIARNDNETGEHKLTKTGALVGSPAYMSPEQCKGQKLDYRTDIYSLGCVMYEALCGKPPFAGENSVNVLMMHLNDVVPPMESVRSDLELPPRLPELIYSCLEKEPAQRPQSMNAVLQQMQKAFEDEPVKLKSKRSNTRALKHLKSGLFVAALLLAVGFAYTLLASNKQNSPEELVDARWMKAKAELKQADSKREDRRYKEACDLYKHALTDLDSIIASKSNGGILAAVKLARRKSLMHFANCQGQLLNDKSIQAENWKKIVSVYKEDLGPNSLDTADAEINLARLLLEGSKSADMSEISNLVKHAISASQRELDSLSNDLDYESASREKAKYILTYGHVISAQILEKQRKFKEAIREAEKAIAVTAPEYNTQTFLAKVLICKIYSQEGKSSSESEYRDEICKFAKGSALSYHDKIIAVSDLFDYYISVDDYKSANCVLNVMNELSTGQASAASPQSVARVWVYRALILAKENKKRQALEQADRAQKLLRTLVGGDAPLNVWNMLISVYDSLGAEEEKKSCAKALEQLQR